MDKDTHVDVAEWKFPDLDITQNINDVISLESVMEFDSIDDQLAMQTSDNSDSIINNTDNADNVVNLAGVNEVDSLRNEYESKIKILESMISKLTNPLSCIDNEILDILRSIIKKSVKHIINQELKDDPLILNNVINELIGLSQSQTGKITIAISANDYNRLNMNEQSMKDLIIIDNNLSDGDVVIKSSSSEIRAIVDERIDIILGEKNGPPTG